MSRQSKCHWRIAKIAKEIANLKYEEMAHDNVFFAQWPRRRDFVRINWGLYIDPARESLAGLLARPDFPDDLKEEVYEALMLDGVFNPRALSSIEQAQAIEGVPLRIVGQSSAMH